MRDREHRDDGRPADLLQELGYEVQDIDYGKVIKSGVAYFAFFLAMVAAGYVIVHFMFPTGLAGAKAPDRTKNARNMPPVNAPPLQTNVSKIVDIQQLREGESKRLTGVGVDTKTGKRHIPIDQAVDAFVDSKAVQGG